MCFGGGDDDDTNNTRTPAYAPTPDASASAVTRDSVGPKAAASNTLSMATTQQDQLALGQADTTGLKLGK